MMMDQNLWFDEKNISLSLSQKKVFFVVNFFAIEIPKLMVFE
jgi:hypothetical protein